MRNPSKDQRGSKALCHRIRMLMMAFFLQVLGGKKMELLPGDRDNLAIQTRGGPEKHEVTGWVLVSKHDEFTRDVTAAAMGWTN